VNELAGGGHGHGLDIGGHVAQDGQQAVKQGLEPVVPTRDDLHIQVGSSFRQILYKIFSLPTYGVSYQRNRTAKIFLPVLIREDSCKNKKLRGA
jgi:hypothetical protein